MPNILVVGSQWGDEGKGKIVDFLSNDATVVVRYQGGANAGHTLVISGKKYVLHLIPSGILNKKICVLGQGMVVDYNEFIKEISELSKLGISTTPENVILDENAHLILPYHLIIDAITGKEIGTTGRGIGPAYIDKIARKGIRAKDVGSMGLEEKINKNVGYRNHQINFYLTDEITRRETIRTLCRKNPFLEQFIDDNCYIDAKKVYNDLMEKKQLFSLFIRDAKPILIEAASRCSLLAEGAQGIHLDIDNGSYPYVTSSNTGIGGALNGLGIYVDFDYRIGIAKAYTTRVGEGPFPTELNNPLGEELRQKGGEFGATTGRPRRCGWLDLEVLKKSILASGINYIAMTKIDVLSSLNSIPVCVGYNKSEGASEQPCYEYQNGWNQDISNAKTFDELPTNCQKYVKKIEELLKTKIGIVSVGADRDKTIVIKELN
ncbi:adenylosuccinate synthase [Candidatus Woesearchaeota archaeon]|nr:adenylosuccinate synthase [Candidatus Woesearchaeota archaeon]